MTERAASTNNGTPTNNIALAIGVEILAGSECIRKMAGQR
jgi:hypothetical protein